MAIQGYGYRFTELMTVQNTGRLGSSNLNGTQKTRINSLLYNSIQSGVTVVKAETTLRAMSTKLEALKQVKQKAENLKTYCSTGANQAAGVQAAVTEMMADTNAYLAAQNAYRTGGNLFEDAANSPNVIIGGQSYSSCIHFAAIADAFNTAGAPPVFQQPANDTDAGARTYVGLMEGLINTTSEKINQLQTLMTQLAEAKQTEEQNAINAVEEANAVYEDFDREAVAQELNSLVEASARKNQLTSFLQARLANWVQTLFNLNRA